MFLRFLLGASGPNAGIMQIGLNLAKTSQFLILNAPHHLLNDSKSAGVADRL